MNEKPGNIAKQPAATSTVSTMPSHERDTARSSDKKNDDGWSDSLKTKASAQAEPGDESDDSDLDGEHCTRIETRKQNYCRD